MHISRIVNQLRDKLKGERQVAVQEATGVNQGQISKILKGEVSRVSANIIKLCKYAKVDIEEKVPRKLPPDLESALREAWSGSRSNAKALAGVLKAIRRFQATATIKPRGLNRK